MNGTIAPLPVPLGEAISAIALLAILVGMSLSVQRQAGSQRVLLWAYAWTLTSLHFVLRILQAGAGRLLNFTVAADYSAIELSGIVFIASFLFREEDRRKRHLVIALLGVPLVVHLFATYCVDGAFWVRSAAFAFALFGAAALCYFGSPRRTFAQLLFASMLGAIGTWGTWQNLRGESTASIGIITTLIYVMCGVFFWRLYRRRSLGVITVTGGFIAWAALFPLTAYMFFHRSGPAIVQTRYLPASPLPMTRMS